MFLCETKVVMNIQDFNMTALSELSYLLAGFVAIIGAMRVFYQVSSNKDEAVKGTVFSSVGFCISFLILGLMAS